MHHAAEKGRLDLIKFLVEKSAQMDIEDNEGPSNLRRPCSTPNAQRSTLDNSTLNAECINTSYWAKCFVFNALDFRLHAFAQHPMLNVQLLNAHA
jgi:hypothetical protein